MQQKTASTICFMMILINTIKNRVEIYKKLKAFI